MVQSQQDAKQSTLSDRVRVMTALEDCEDKVKELEELEAERDNDDSEDELSTEVREDISSNLQKVKGFIASHTENTHNIAQMCNYILTIMEESPTDDKKRKDVQDEMDKARRDDKTIKEKLTEWRRINRRWIVKPKKKEVVKDKGEPVKSSGSGKDRWLETFARDLKPASNLQDDGDLRSMKAWKAQMMIYTSYIKQEFKLTPRLFYDMKKKLDTVKGFQEMGEEGIWDAIEKFWIESNPMFMRRLKAIDLKPEKGEETSDYYNRLKA